MPNTYQDVRDANTLRLFGHPTVDYDPTRHHGLQSSPRNFRGQFSRPLPGLSLVFTANAQNRGLWPVYQVTRRPVCVGLHFHVNA